MKHIFFPISILLLILSTYLMIQRYKIAMIQTKYRKSHDIRVIRSNEQIDFYKTIDGFSKIGYVVSYKTILLFSKNKYVAILVRPRKYN